MKHSVWNEFSDIIKDWLNWSDNIKAINAP